MRRDDAGVAAPAPNASTATITKGAVKAKDTPSTAHFLRVPTTLLDLDLPAGALVLYGLIDNMALSKGTAWPSTGYLAKKLRVHRSTVSRWVGLLEAAGVLRVERTFGAVSQYGTCTQNATGSKGQNLPHNATGSKGPVLKMRQDLYSKCDTNKTKQQEAAAADHREPTPSPLNDDRSLAEAEARRRQANGTQIRNFPAYVNAILKDPDVMARLRKPKAEWVTGGQADSPTQCLHSNKAHLPALDDDEPDTLRCVACGEQWPAGLEAVG